MVLGASVEGSEVREGEEGFEGVELPGCRICAGELAYQRADGGGAGERGIEDVGGVYADEQAG